ncbi:MAG: IS1595 family transposase [Acidobacteria bacterium]|nr:IS1595 family transposase [Acidobacteriota bacterium]
MKRNTSAVLEALRAACNDEGLAIAFFEVQRWGDSPACPRCGDLNVYRMAGKAGAKDRRWRCRGCQRMYTVRTGTTLEETRLPLKCWAFALWSACSSKKGVSALQISRECEISYKSALFLMHRIRRGMATDGPHPKLEGTVEADETFVGGKPRHKGSKPGPRADKPKAPVFGVVQRGGELRLRALDRLTASKVQEALRENVEATRTRLMTDESAAYKAIGHEFAGGHGTTEHSWKEYVSKEDPSVHSNTIEGAFSLLKRGIYGTFHSVSRKHLHRYCAEFEFRYNARKLDDGQRVALAVKTTEGKRLTYREQVGG